MNVHHLHIRPLACFVGTRITRMMSSPCHYSTTSQMRIPFVTRLQERLRPKGKLKLSKSKLKSSGYNMYTCCQRQIDFGQLFDDLDMPDTFNSWFLLTDLHIWLCMVRLAQLGSEGHIIRNSLVSTMWLDVNNRSKLIAGRLMRNDIQHFADIFFTSLFSYDEGLMSDDKTLAGAVWRQLYERSDKSPEHLSLMVNYIRKQALHLDYQNPDLILQQGLLTFLPLHGDVLDKDRINKQLFSIYGKNMVT